MRRETTLMFVALVMAAPAIAQPAAEDAHNQSIGGGAQWALPYSGRGDMPGLQASWRRWFSPRVGIGADVRWWGRNTTVEFNTPAQEGPAGALIAPARGREDRRISSYGVGLGVLAQGSIGRLSLLGGAGPGFFVDRTSYQRQINDLQHDGWSAQRSIGVHALAEIEFRATSRVSVFMGLRTELRDLRFPGSTSGYPTAGARFAF
jgi:hypothetical protein